MTQEATSKTFVPDTKRAGDLIKSQDWNTAMGEIVRLEAAKVNRSGEDTLAGPLTIQAGLSVQGNLGVPNGSLGLGIASPAKKLHIEGGELRVRAGHNNATSDIAAFYSQNLTLGIGIGNNTIAAVGSSANQDITLTPKGTGAIAISGNFKLGKGATITELSVDGTLAGNADTALPTQKAVKTYVDSKVAGLSTQDFTAKSFTATGSLALGITTPAKKLHVEGGELRVRASHDSATADIGAFFSQNQTLGIGIGSSTIAAIGSSANQDITLSPKGTGAVLLNGNVGIGTTTPAQKLEVAGSLKVTGGAIIPTAGGTETTGIMFPKDPFGGGGDAAWIRYYRRGDTGESTTFEMGTNNDADDHIALMASGNVGIGTNTPTQKLDVAGSMKISGIIVQQDWQTPTMQNNWVKYNDEYNAPGYFKDSQGIVHLKGLVRGGAKIGYGDDAVIFILPTGYRPASRQEHATISNNGFGRCDIAADGKVRACIGGTDTFSLDGITFKAFIG